MTYEREIVVFCYEENCKNSRIRELVTEAIKKHIDRDAPTRGQQSDKDVPATRLPCMVHQARSTTVLERYSPQTDLLPSIRYMLLEFVSQCVVPHYRH